MLLPKLSMCVLLGPAFLNAQAGSSGDSSQPIRVAIIGLVHGHAGGFLSGGALVPAGGASKRSDVRIVGVVEPDNRVFESYANRYHWPASMRFASIDELASHVHPQAALIFTSTAGHTSAVEKCAALGIHVMMEKPMAVSYKDAVAIAAAAHRGHVHVLVDYETSWYSSNIAARGLLERGELGPITKAVFRDGHNGPSKIHVSQEFLKWLTDPRENGAGALYDFGCYGADLMTWLMHGEAPQSVTAVTRHLQPELYPKVDDEADVILTYSKAVALLQGSWDWPFGVKDSDVYGVSGYVKTVGSTQIETRRSEAKDATAETAPAVRAPYDDPLHYLAAVIRGEIDEGDDLSSLKTNVIVSEILDAARQSAQSGKTVALPLN
jgi:predicted dehydrogenase